MEHSINPPTKLVQQWKRTAPHPSNETEHYQYITLCAAQWGADQELKECSALMDKWGLDGPDLLECRRPKPPSLKEQALAALQEAAYMADDSPPQGICSDQIDIIRKALEQLND